MIVGILSDVYSGVAGAADHAAGSTDEAVGRFFRDSARYQESGGLEQTPGQRAAAYSRILTRHTLGPGAEDFIFTSPSGSFLGNQDDTNLLGPGVTGEGSVTDVLIDRSGERRSAAESKTKLFLLLVAGGIGLYLLKPLLELLSGVAGE
jgi:hypothetical protein